MSFVAELKQRKVFRVATVYLVVAWVVVCGLQRENAGKCGAAEPAID